MVSHLKIATALVNLLDLRYRLFGVRFGLDPLLGIIPGLGDIIPFILGLYIIYIGTELDLPSDKIGTMIVNLFFDLLIGSIPFVGDLTDFFYKANVKNLRIIHDYLETKPIEGRLIARTVN